MYWIPVYEILESHGLHVMQANARDVLRYLADYYNHQRPHSYNRYKTRVQAESLAGWRSAADAGSEVDPALAEAVAQDVAGRPIAIKEVAS